MGHAQIPASDSAIRWQFFGQPAGQPARSENDRNLIGNLFDFDLSLDLDGGGPEVDRSGQTGGGGENCRLKDNGVMVCFCGGLFWGEIWGPGQVW